MEKDSLIFLLLSGLLVGALFLSHLSERLRTPDILWFMLLGLALGPTGFGILSGEALMGTGHVFLLGAVFLVLYEAGLRTRLDRVRDHGIAISLLVTFGLLLTAILLSFALHFLFGMTLYEGLLLGAILSTTDPASILPILRRLPIPSRLTETLVAESALGDVTGSLLTLFILSLSTPGHTFSGTFLNFSLSVLWGGLIGAIMGGVVILLAIHPRIGLFRQNLPILMLSGLLAGFGLSLALHGQTLLCGYVLGIVAGGASRFLKKDGAPFSSEAFKTVNDLVVYLASFFVFPVKGTAVPRAVPAVAPPSPVTITSGGIGEVDGSPQVVRRRAAKSVNRRETGLTAGLPGRRGIPGPAPWERTPRPRWRSFPPQRRRRSGWPRKGGHRG